MRRALAPEVLAEKGRAAQAALAALPSFRGAHTIALYAAQWFEVPTDALWEGKRVCLPRVVPGQRVLSFHHVADRTQLVPRGKLQLREPPDGAEPVSLQAIDLWVVPGVGFTADGERLGRGAGHYDATLAHARPDAVKVGLTWACCLVAALPTEAHDLKMDAVVTEAGLVSRSR